MVVIVCLDDREGMMFNGRRQSRDRVLLADVAAMTRGVCLRAAPCSEKLLREHGLSPVIGEDFLSVAEEGDWCFLEDRGLSSYRDKLERLVIYRWNRHYPGDLFWDLEPGEAGLRLTQRTEFVGSSHETITKEIFEK
ncbi:MAG: ribonuclease Z [Clostridia bacterium]|nr:ribonuclease Z [Clostridia bacterium]